MSADESRKTKPEDAQEPLNRGIGISAGVINLITLIAVWGNPWHMGLVVLVSVSLYLFNSYFDGSRFERFGRDRIELLRTVMNVAGAVVMGHATGWPMPIWLWLPFQGSLGDFYQSRRIRMNQVLYFLSFTAFGLYDGVDWRVPALFGILQAICYAIGETRALIIRRTEGRLAEVQALLAERDQTNEQLTRAHEELKVYHQRALTQEKLSSLGMLAAGIAHEINNPMSFITSNINGLAAELGALEQIPEGLAEYRDDVLPATVDGIRRVNTIVADLRRFARGDPESMVQYDLNHEIRAAARILQAKFRGSCRLDLNLGELPPLLGRPQQLTQVFLNLLVNASQAMTGEGVVTVTSHAANDAVLIRVVDTGAGMSEQTMASLFQPFFTTKAVGEGTGLGLAVTYGIVKAHGGTVPERPVILSMDEVLRSRR